MIAPDLSLPPDTASGSVSGFGEILARFARNPGRTAGLLAVTAVMSVLGLTVSLFVIQVLNRFVTHGVNGTLATLTVGALLAVLAEHLLRQLRWRLAEEIAGDQDRRLATGVFGLMLTARYSKQATWSPARQIELLRGVDRVRQTLGPAGLTLVADLPFSLLVLTALLLLSPALAAVTMAFCCVLMLAAWADQRRLRGPSQTLGQVGAAVGTLAGAAVNAGETVRCFNAHDAMMSRWRRIEAAAGDIGRRVGWLQLHGGSLAQAAQGALGIAIVAVGALQVVRGELDVGSLVGANMIAGRALQPFARVVQFGASLRAAGAALAEARRFATISLERTGGRTLPDWRGALRLEGVVPVSGAAPVNADIRSGAVVVVVGRNGAGKSSLLRLLAGLEEAEPGRILADGADLRQLALPWWRASVSYMPQEPFFLPGTLRENLLFACPTASDATLTAALEAADLGDFLSRQPRHLDMEIDDGGRTLAPGVRRRLALARALVVDGRLYLLDEPSEGLDRAGCQVVYQRLIGLAQRGRTLVIATHDPAIIAGASLVIDLDTGTVKVGGAA